MKTASGAVKFEWIGISRARGVVHGVVSWHAVPAERGGPCVPARGSLSKTLTALHLLRASDGGVTSSPLVVALRLLTSHEARYARMLLHSNPYLMQSD